jgi:5-methylcytosine-specific restriction protein A
MAKPSVQQLDSSAPADRRDNYADYSIYTIRHSNTIDQFSRSKGPHHIDTKRKRWTSAKQIIADARRQNKIVPLLFARAEDTTSVVARADLISVHTGTTNRCTFENVQYLSQPIRKTTLAQRDGTKIGAGFIRDYAICRTPASHALFDAEHSFRRLVPNKYLKNVLNELGRSVQFAHQVNSSKWGLRLSPRHDNIMLKVGMVEVCQLNEDVFRQLLERKLIPAQLLADRRLKFDTPSYKNAPGCVGCNMTFTMVAKVCPALSPAHQAAIRIAARSPRHVSTTKDHSQALVMFLSQEMRNSIDQPSYHEANGQGERYFPEEVFENEGFEEGAAIKVLVNRYERDTSARRRCLQHHGTKCAACGIALVDRYGPEAQGLIHVHHLTPLADIGTNYSVDPVRDLRPVCPNCHAVIHWTTPPRTIKQIQTMLEARKRALREV